MEEQIDKLRNIINNSNRIVFFGGAGVSTESGIPDFRSTDGLYSHKYRYSPEEMLSHSFFMSHTSEFYRFYRDKMIYEDAKPNKAHEKLAEWEKEGKLKAVITQNIDGLHQKAGSKNVIELHGSIFINYCIDCSKFYDIDKIKNSIDIPLCDCGGIIKPDVVLYQEQLKDEVLKDSTDALTTADTLIISGTSLKVFPASTLVKYFYGEHLIIINKTKLDFENDADVVIHDGIAKTLEKV